jgi:hypothetical protein
MMAPVRKLRRNLHADAIAAATRKLNDLRDAWLNPPELVIRVPEVVPGYPDRIVPKDDAAAKVLAKRTLTNLYNDRPQWLIDVHKELDDAVARAYGWPADLSDDEVVERLFNLNQQRAAEEAAVGEIEMPKEIVERFALLHANGCIETFANEVGLGNARIEQIITNRELEPEHQARLGRVRIEIVEELDFEFGSHCCPACGCETHLTAATEDRK